MSKRFLLDDSTAVWIERDAFTPDLRHIEFFDSDRWAYVGMVGHRETTEGSGPWWADTGRTKFGIREASFQNVKDACQFLVDMHRKRKEKRNDIRQN